MPGENAISGMKGGIVVRVYTRKCRVAILLIIVLLLCGMVCVNYASAEQTGTVYGGWLILRSSPSYSGTALASYPSGTVVTITGQNGSWYSVRTPDGRSGYMLGTYLRIQGSSAINGTKARVTSQNGLSVCLRSGPGTGYEVLASYAPGTECTVLSAGTSWSRIQIGKRTGYMMSRYLTKSGSDNSSVSGLDPVNLPVPSGYSVWVTSKNGKGVNLRSGPSKDTSSIGLYNIGTSASMITLGYNWSYIRIGDVNGYMMTDYLTADNASGSGNVAPATGGAYVISANGKSVNLRNGPGIDNQVIRTYPSGTPLTIITRGTEWNFVQIGNDYGYMMRSFIREN